MSGEQTNINMQPQADPLLQYRVTKLEEAVSVLSEGFSEIADTVKGAKWAVLLIFGLVQPIAIAVAIHFLTKG